MSTLAACIAILLLVLSPLFVPLAVTVVHGVSVWRAKAAVMKQGRQGEWWFGNVSLSPTRVRACCARGDSAPAEVATGQIPTARPHMSSLNGVVPEDRTQSALSAPHLVENVCSSTVPLGSRAGT